ncbi:MAG: serine/threonine-protein kinase [Candidatus Obscuribacterales bacterium]
MHTSDSSSKEPAPLRLTVGTVLDGRYEILEYLGCGGMGSVYRARHLELNRDAAIKTMHPRYMADASAARRFQREARIISSLRHKNVLTIYSFGGYSGFIYLAMEFVEGVSLGRIVSESGRLAPEQCLPLLLQICEGMAYAHRQNVLHRDLKPDNVMVLGSASIETSVAKIVDFGLSRLLDGTDEQLLTRTGEVVGDPRYMSPEQCRGESLDGRADIYSFGCLMYEVLTGRWPFEANDPVAILNMHVSKEPDKFAEQLKLPNSLEAITFTAMAKDRRDRYVSFDELADALSEFRKNPFAKSTKIRATADKVSLKRLGLTRQKVLLGISALFVFALALTVVFKRTDIETILARVRYEQSSNAADKIDILIDLAADAGRRGDSPSAIKNYIQAAELAELSGDSAATIRVYGALGEVYTSCHDEQSAANAYAKCLGTATNFFKQGKGNKGIARICVSSLKAYAKLQPIPAVVAGHQMADALRTSGRCEYANSILSCLLAVEPAQLRANTLSALGENAIQCGEIEQARRYFDQAITALSDSKARIPVLQLAGSQFYNGHHNQLALKYFNQLLDETRDKAYPQLSELHMRIGDVYAQLNDRKNAKLHYAKSVSLERNQNMPGSPLVIGSLNGLADCELADRHLPEAAEFLRQVLTCLTQKKPRDFAQEYKTYSKLGDMLSELNRRSEAAKVYGLALESLKESKDNRLIQADGSLIRTKIRACQSQSPADSATTGSAQ